MGSLYAFLLSILTLSGPANGMQFNTAFIGRKFVPNAFSFTNVSGATPNTTVVSNSVSLTGIGVRGVSAFCSGGCELQLNASGSWSTSLANVRRGDALLARLPSSPAGTTMNMTITVGGVSSPWSVTTAAARCVQIAACIDGVDTFTISGGVITHIHYSDSQVGTHSPCSIGGGGFFVDGALHSPGSSTSANIPTGMTAASFNFNSITPPRGSVSISGNVLTMSDSGLSSAAMYTANVCE